MMFDAHIHWLPGEIIDNAHFYSIAWGNIEGQLEVMDKFHIDKALIVYPTNDAYRKMGGLKEVARLYNDRIAGVVGKYPERFAGAAILPVDEPEEMAGEFERVTKGLDFKALSLATSFDGVYLDDERFYHLYEEAESLDMPIFVHPQTINPIGYERIKDPLLTPAIEFVFDTTICIGKLIMAGTLRRFPGLKFVFAHFGGVTPFIKERFDSIYRMLRGRDIVKDLFALPSEYLRRIYVDTSGVTSGYVLMCTLEMVGAEHILWGSDYPGNPDITTSISAIEKLEIPAREKAKILGTNMERVLAGALS
ncbi:MAG: amidohydrolase family protein [Dehalococcoidales bacterium]|nr:amidohydrolase family protein [Dehalococcoidales bacterium]